MNMARSSGYSAVAVEPASFADRTAMRSVVRWAVLGAAGVIALIIALSQSMAASAAAPVAYDSNTNCIQINFTTCMPIAGYVANPTTYITNPAPAAATGTYLVRTYFDYRYCGGVVNIVSENGVLINRCPDGTRVFPVYGDYGNGFVGSYLGGNYVGAAFLNTPTYIAPSYIPPGTYNGITCNGLYGCPFGGNVAVNGAFPFNYLNGNLCNVNVNCLNTFPAGGTVVGGVVFYNDNRFCTDGKLAFVPGRGYFCQNGGPLVTNGAATVNCSNFFFNGCGIWRGFEADAAPATQPQQVTAFAAPAAKAPVVAPAAPVVAPAAPVIAPAAVVAPAAPVVAPAAPVTAKAATALNAPVYVPVGSTVDPSDRG
jgi:hypothetical protein